MLVAEIGFAESPGNEQDALRNMSPGDAETIMFGGDSMSRYSFDGSGHVSHASMPSRRAAGYGQDWDETPKGASYIIGADWTLDEEDEEKEEYGDGSYTGSSYTGSGSGSDFVSSSGDDGRPSGRYTAREQDSSDDEYADDEYAAGPRAGGGGYGMLT